MQNASFHPGVPQALDTVFSYNTQSCGVSVSCSRACHAGAVSASRTEVESAVDFSLAECPAHSRAGSKF